MSTLAATGVVSSAKATTPGSNIADRQSTTTIINDVVLVISLCLLVGIDPFLDEMHFLAELKISRQTPGSNTGRGPVLFVAHSAEFAE